MTSKKGNEIPRCSFCGGTPEQVGQFITSPTKANICKNCSEVCVNLFDKADTSIDRKKPDSYIANLKISKPAEIKEHLDNYVIGQEKAKKSLAVAVHNHYKRLQINRERFIQGPRCNRCRY